MKTVVECRDEILKVLKEHKVKEQHLELVEDDLIHFRTKGVLYSIHIESEENVHFGIMSIDNVDIDVDFYARYDVVEDWQYVDDFMYQIQYDEVAGDMKKIGKALDRLVKEIEDEDLLLDMVTKYFRLER
jgi:L-rhamnose mutarotase